MPDKPETFFKRLNDTGAVQFLSFAGTIGTFVGIIVSLVQGLISLGSKSDTDQIRDAINKLQFELQVDFRELGDLIKLQSQLIRDTVNRNDMATALSHTDAALIHLNTFLRTGDEDDLRFADNESILGLQFFLELNQTPPDVFFMPGLVKAGTSRVALIAVRDPKFLTSRPDDVNQIRQMVSLVSAMITLTKQRINSAHVVVQKSHLIPTFPEPKFVIDGFAHEENVEEINGDVTPHQLQFFSTRGHPEDPEDPGAVAAFVAAQNARNQGVADELAFIGIPDFEAVLQDWTTLLGGHILPGGPVVSPPTGPVNA